MRRARRCMCLMGLAVACLVAFAGCAQEASAAKRHGFLLDTFVTVTVYGAADAEQMLDGAMALCRAYEAQFSRTIAASDISRINNAQGEPVEVHEETARVLEAALAYSRASNGFFDVTIGGASVLWNFKAEKPSLPLAADVAAVLAGVGYENLIVEGNTVRLASAATRLDLGAIAKGYISDQLAAYVQAEGVLGAVINLGGNVVTVGERHGGTAWDIGVQKPFAQAGVTVGTLRITGGAAIVTTGVYERSFTLDGTLYHHILNPQTGFPAESDLHAVTIVADSGMAADALGTIVFGMGAEAGLAYLEDIPDAEGILIRADGRIDVTTGIGAEGKIVFERQ